MPDLPPGVECLNPLGEIQESRAIFQIFLEKFCFCLGEGQNYAFLQRLNAQRGYFQEIIPQDHPRFTMQYKRKAIDLYVQSYLASLCDR